MIVRPALTVPTQTFRGYYIYSNAIMATGPAGAGWNSVSKRISVTSSLHGANNSNTSSASNGSWFKRLLYWYSHKLDTYPLITNATTCAFIATSGDFLCQYVSFYRRKGNSVEAQHYRNTKQTQTAQQDTFSKYSQNGAMNTPLHTDTPQQEHDSSLDTFHADQMRLARFGAMGFFLVAPSVYVWFGALHMYVPGSSVWAVTKRVLYDQLVYSPIFEPILVLSLMAMEGRSQQHMMDFLTNGKLSALVVANWVLWFPAQFINFAFVPFKWQVLFSNLVSVIWNAYLSWTTFEQDDDHVQEHFVHPT